MSIAMEAGHRDIGVLLYAHVNFRPGSPVSEISYSVCILSVLSFLVVSRCHNLNIHTGLGRSGTLNRRVTILFLQLASRVLSPFCCLD